MEENYNKDQSDNKKDTELRQIHEEALSQFDTVQSAVKDEREQCLEDRRFCDIAGAQWEGALGEQFANKPKFEINKVHLAVKRIYSEYRNNRISVDFLSREDDDDISNTCDALYRADESDSDGEEAYDNAFNEAVKGGIGAWRYRAEYEDEEDDENEQQRIRIEPIYDADSSVFWDINAKKYDKSDAKYCFVISSMSREAYIAEFDDDPTSWSKEISSTEFDWDSPDIVYVAEYYKVEHVKDEIKIYTNVMGAEERYNKDAFEDDPELEYKLISKGFKLSKTKKVKKKKVRKYILSGGGVLEDCGHIAGKNIPIVPVYGERVFVDNIERCMGHVRLAKDAQRLKNMQLSKLGEITASSPIEKPIVSPEQISGHQLMWEQDNIENYPYMLLNSLKDANGNILSNAPLAYTKPIDVPPALSALLQITDFDMKEILGNREAAEKMVSNISGEAIQKITDQLDMQSYIYLSNLAKSMKRGGEIWLSMAQDIYVEDNREVVGIDNGKLSKIKLNTPELTESGAVKYKNDISNAKMSVFVDVGPSSSSKKNATVDKLTRMLQVVSDPETASVISTLTLMNMEGEGLSDARQYFRKKLVRMGVIQPNEQEHEELAEELANQQPTPQDQYLISESKKLETEAVENQVNTQLTAAKIEETTAKTLETLAGIERENISKAIELSNQMNQPEQQMQASQMIPGQS